MKKSVMAMIAAVVSCTLCFAFGCSGNRIPPVTGDGSGEASNWRDDMNREDNDFLQDDNRRPSREPFVDLTPEDDGTPTSYRFEAEAAKIRGTTSGEDHFCTAKSTEFSPSFSGNITLCNLGTATLSFTFQSDKAVRSTLLLRMANQYSSSTGGVLSAYANMTVNDKPVVDLTPAFDAESGEAASGSSESYFTMVTVETKISIAEGKNVLAITPATANYLNLDYIELRTSAAIEDETEPTITDPSSFVNIVTVPTQTEGGRISFVCHNKTEAGEETACKNDNARARALPNLTDGIYDEQVLENGTRHTVRLYGEDVIVASSVLWELTLQNATFADGTSTAKVAPGSTPKIDYTVPEGQVFSHWEDADGNDLGSIFVMPDKDITIRPVFVDAAGAVTVTLQGATLNGAGSVSALAGNPIDLSGAEFIGQPAGTELYYWYNVENPRQYFSDPSAFIVPETDITIAPAFDKTEYASADGSTTGKVSIFPRNGYAERNETGGQSAGGYIRAEGDNGVKGDTRSAYWGIVGDEMGAVYHWTVKEGFENLNGFYFTPLSPYKVVSSKEYTIRTTIQNQGTQELTLKLYQTNAGGTPKPAATASEEFTLGVGEIKTVTITFRGFNNNNIMTTVELLTEGLTDLYVGMYQYIEDGSEAPATYTLTLDGATFADGTTTGEFAAGARPELKYTTPDRKVFSHWEDAEGNDLGQTFVMPDRDITIKPVFVDTNAVVVTLQNATLHGKDTIDTVAGSELDLSEVVFADQPEGTVLRYWYNVNDVRQRFGEEGAVIVPGTDITLAPAFDKEVYANADGSTTGKVSIFPRNGYDEMKPVGSSGTVVQPAGGYIRALEESGVKGYDAYWGIVGNEMGAVYHWTAAEAGGHLANGFYFTPLSPYKVSSAFKYILTTTLQNLGEDEIKLKLYQTNSSSNFRPAATCSEEITLAPGATGTVTIVFANFSNNNIMTTVELLTDGLSDLHLGLYQYIEKVSFTLTLENATFADGSVSGKVAFGDTPDLRYAEPAKHIFSHWEDTDGNNLGEVFTMPERDITIRPVFVESDEVVVTLQGATLDGESVINTLAGRKLDLSEAVIAERPEGKILKGWFDVNDRTKLYTGSFSVEHDVTLAPLFDTEDFYSKTNHTGKIAPNGKFYSGREKNCHSVIPNQTSGAVKSGDGEYYEAGSIYHFKGGTAEAPAQMAEGAYFVTQEMNGLTALSNVSKTVTTTVENLGSEDITLRFALTTSSGNPASAVYGEYTVTIKAGESVTFTFDVSKVHDSIMNFITVQTAVEEVYIGMYQYISDTVTA